MRVLDARKLSLLVAEHTKRELDENRIGCKEVLVHQDGKCVYSAVFGTKSVGGEEAGRGLIYRAASMTKPITAVAVLLLADRGVLKLDDKISKFFPKAKDLKVATVENGKIVSLAPLKREITVENLLSHTSGMGCSPVADIAGKQADHLTFDEAVDVILSKPLSFEPDAMERYGTTEAFDIAAAIVQKVSNKPFDVFLKENLFDPLEMVNTTFSPTEEQWENTVIMHARTEAGKSEDSPCVDGCVFEDFPVYRRPAGAGLVTTAEDYMKFADMLCFFGETKDKRRILTQKAAKLISTPHTPANFENWCEKWGLSVRIVTENTYPHMLPVGSFGWSGAYGSHFWVDRENRISAVMMKNSRFDGGSGNASACQLEEDVCSSLR